MRLQRIALLTFAIVLPWLSLYSEGLMNQEQMSNVQFLNIKLENTEVSLALADKPLMTYDHDVLSFYMRGGAIQIPVAKVKGWVFSEAPTAIKQYETKKANVFQGTAYLTNLKPGSNVFVYNTEGELMRSEIANELGEAILEFGSLPKGIYILKTSDFSIKIINK